MSHVSRWMVLSMWTFCCMVLIGCETNPAATDAADDDDHPKTYGEAVDVVAQLAEQIKNASEKDDLGAAHDQLHEIGHIILDIPALADKASLAADKIAEIKTATEQLMQKFGKLDEQLHGAKEKVTYADLSGDIDSAMKVLTDAK